MATILIVDDNAAHRLLLKQIVESEGHTVCGEAIDGEEAIDLYKETNPDIVAMDLCMPDSDGLVGIKEIYNYNINAKIIVTTATSENKQLMQTVKTIVSSYIQKPFNKTQIITAINEALCED